MRGSEEIALHICLFNQKYINRTDSTKKIHMIDDDDFICINTQDSAFPIFAGQER